MVDFIMKFITVKDEQFDNYDSYIRKYYLVDFIWWTIHRLLCIVSFAIVSIYATWVLNFGNFALMLILIVTTIPSLFIWWLCTLPVKWMNIKNYVKRRR